MQIKSLRAKRNPTYIVTPVYWLGLCRSLEGLKFLFTLTFGESVSLGYFNTVSSVKVLQI